ncbi:MAG: CvpA family protein [Candidatus Marinimicrobia bacterium]|jgi:membrane protein required for colicin V production|nr:CvpA family protein [Candidatus Neomarinimicrobiota bacterium]MDP6852979.1 CvpA family protein [Candidatus Neomarinimicrobiota bacterium]MDP6936632.1 CvpA family protein [Candidatus Neomarinimicrobiota bacterium]
MSITPPDIVIALILGYFTFNGLRHGFIEEMARLISLIGGFILASKFHQQLLPILQPYFSEGSVRVTVAYLLVFVASAVTITIIAKILQKFIELVLLGWLNRVLGLLLGMLKGFLIVSLLIFIIQAIPLKLDENHTIRQKLENDSVMYQICDHVKELVILTVPMDNKLDSFQQKIKELSDEEKVQDILNSP